MIENNLIKIKNNLGHIKMVSYFNQKDQYLLLVIHALRRSMVTLKGEKNRISVPERSVDNMVFEGCLKKLVY